MLKILMLLLTFTDFELSGQNIEPEEKRFCKFKQLNFMIHMGTIYYIWCMYIFICKRTRNQFNQKISTSGQIFFKVGLIWLVRGNSRSQELFRHKHNTSGGRHTTPFFRPHHKWRQNSQLFLPATPYFVWAMLLCFQMYHFMPFNTFFKFRERYVIQYGLIIP